MLIGIIAAGTNYACSKFLTRSLSNLITLIVLVIITAGLHIDGFADTLDSLYAGKTIDERLKIMSNSHMGAIGTIGIVLLLLTKFLLLTNISQENIFPGMLFVCSVTRFCLIIPITFSISAKPDGLGKLFTSTAMSIDCFSTGFLTIILVYFLSKTIGVALLGIALFFTILLMKYFERLLGGDYR